GDQGADPVRGGHAGGVAEGDPVRTVGDHPVHDAGDPGRVDVPFVRAAERGRDDHLGGGAVPVQVVDEHGDVVQRLGGAPVHVAPVVGVAGGDHHLHLGEPGGEGPRGAAPVRHQGAVADVIGLLVPGPTLVSVRQPDT